MADLQSVCNHFISDTYRCDDAAATSVQLPPSQQQQHIILQRTSCHISGGWQANLRLPCGLHHFLSCQHFTALPCCRAQRSSSVRVQQLVLVMAQGMHPSPQQPLPATTIPGIYRVRQKGQVSQAWGRGVTEHLTGFSCTVPSGVHQQPLSGDCAGAAGCTIALACI